MNATDLQQQFFSHLKSILPPHISLADELSELLDLSYDSVYRRIRGEKPLAMNELRQICERYHLSLDQVLKLQNDSVVFQASAINNPVFLFEDYLKGILQQMRYFNSFKERQMLYLCKDLPIWQFYLYPEVGIFKTFFWIKTLLNQPGYTHKSFSLSDNSFQEFLVVGSQINKEYNEIPCVELWNKESINSTLGQIEYYRDAGLFKTRNDLDIVVDSFEKTLDHLELQAEKGVKFMPGSSEVSYRAPLQLYINEVVIGSNTILAVVDNTKIAFIPYNVFTYLATKDVRFNASAFQAFENLASRSTLISATGEKERRKIFQLLKDRVRNLKR
jgi:hypothetical protein